MTKNQQVFLCMVNILTSGDSTYPSSSSESTSASARPLISTCSSSPSDDCIMSEPEYADDVSDARDPRLIRWFPSPRRKCWLCCRTLCTLCNSGGNCNISNVSMIFYKWNVHAKNNKKTKSLRTVAGYDQIQLDTEAMFSNFAATNISIMKYNELVAHV